MSSPLPTSIEPTPKTPYDDWPLNADVMEWEIHSAIAESDPPRQIPTWSKGSKGKGRKPDKPHQLTELELAVGLWAVKCVGKDGITAGQVNACFKVCIAKGCHRSQACKIIHTLAEWGLIEKFGNYSSGRHGNRYKLKGEPTPELMVWEKFDMTDANVVPIVDEPGPFDP